MSKKRLYLKLEYYMHLFLILVLYFLTMAIFLAPMVGGF